MRLRRKEREKERDRRTLCQCNTKLIVCCWLRQTLTELMVASSVRTCVSYVHDGWHQYLKIATKKNTHIYEEVIAPRVSMFVSFRFVHSLFSSSSSSLLTLLSFRTVTNVIKWDIEPSWYVQWQWQKYVVSHLTGTDLAISAIKKKKMGKSISISMLLIVDVCVCVCVSVHI